MTTEQCGKYSICDYGVSKSRICGAILWVEITLIKDGTFALPSKQNRLKPNNKISIAIIDTTGR